VKLGGLLDPTARPSPRRNLSALAVTAVFSVLTVGIVGYANKDCTVLTVWSSQEKSDLLQDIAKKYNDAAPPVDRKCVTVSVVQKASGDAELALRDLDDDAASRPDVWWPAASSWVLLLKEHRAVQKRPEIVPAVTPSLIQSPLVIAMPQQMAETLRRSGEGVGWNSVLKFAQDQLGWDRYGKPWGRFRLGKTNPMISTSGLHALIGTYNAAVGTPNPLTADEIRRPEVQRFVRGVEFSVVHYAQSVATFMENLWNADDSGDALGYVSAVAVEEKQVYDYNRGNPSSLSCEPVCPRLAPKEKLVALSPIEGTLVANHPYVVLTWADAEHQQAAVNFERHLESDAVQSRFLREGFRDHNGQPGPVLDAEHFDRLRPTITVQLPERSVLAAIQASWSDLRKRANVLIAIDVGRSMAEVVSDQHVTKFELAKRAALEALKLLQDDEQVGLWTFSTTATVATSHREVMPLTPLGQGRSELVRLIGGLEPESGARQLFATVLAGVEHVRSHLAKDSVNAVVVLSGGIDEGTDVGFFDLLSKLRNQPNDERVRVFTIAYSGDSRSASTLRQIAEASPGATYDAADPAKILKVLRDVISNF
jgi:Ca-activated chloride channel homolog